MDTNEAIETAHAFPDAMIVPVHYEGWAHFTQSRDDLEKSFNALGFGSQLRLLEPGGRDDDRAIGLTSLQVGDRENSL